MTTKIQELESRIETSTRDGTADAGTVDLLHQLAHALAIDEPRRALEVGTRALESAEALSYDSGIAYSKLAVAFAHLMLSGYDYTMPHLMDSLDLFDKLGDEGGRGRNLAMIAQVQLSMGEYDQALGNAFSALKIFRVVNFKGDEAWTTTGIAVGYMELGDYERSLRYHRRALDTFRELEDTVGQARALSGIGTVCQILCDYDEAADYHQQALDLFQSAGNRIGESRSLNDLGTIYQHVEEYDLAREFYLKSLEIRRDLGSRQAESTSLLNLGRLALKEGNISSALENLEAALEIAAQVKAKPKIYQCHEALSQAHEANGDLTASLQHHREFHRIKEEVTGEEAGARVKNLQIGFAVEKSEKDAEIARLKNVELRENNEQLSQLLDELKAAEAQLIQSAKMAALGGLVAGIAHELNTPVGVIRSTLDMVSEFVADLARTLESGQSAEQIRGSRNFQATREAIRDNARATGLAIKRIEKLIGSLKSFARLDRAVFEQFDVHEGIETTLTLLDSRLGGRIEVKRDYGELPRISCYPSELNQVFMNLLTNSIQAIQGPGSITIRTRQDGGRVRLEFADSGSGIPAEQISSLFDPAFNRTGSRVKASLGLIAVYNIIEKHSGEISVESEVGLGTTFTLLLPISLQVWPQIR